MTSVSIVCGEYASEPHVANYAVLLNGGEPVLEFHHRRLVEVLSPEVLHEILRKCAIDAGLLK